MEICRFVAEQPQLPAIVVVDDRAPAEEQRAVRQAFEARPGVVFYGWEEASQPDSPASSHLARCDLGVLAWWPHILREPLLDGPRLGFLNLHPSMLPHGRGKHPNFWAIVEETPFGVSIHWVDRDIDAGPVAFQREVPLTWEDTGGSAYAKAQQEIVDLFRANYIQIVHGDIPRQPQPSDVGRFHWAKELDPASRLALDESMTVRRILNILRARTFVGYPAAKFFDDGQQYEARVEIRAVEPVRKCELS